MRNVPRGRGRRRRGVSLVEVAVAIIVLGVLAAFAVPRFLDSVERARATEAIDYLAAVRAAQERFQLRQGTYCNDLAKLEVRLHAPAWFTIGTPAAGESGDLGDSWSLTLTRTGAAGAYGPYKVVYTDQGFDAINSDIPARINPMRQ
jgi:prepilin-type N-terminal cleavage/methylation domain-containing protein